MGRPIMKILYCVDTMEIIQEICLPLKRQYTNKVKSVDEMTSELCTNMRSQHLLCISYITRGYSHQMLLCFSIIIMVSSFIQVKWKTTLKKQQQK
jgi:hypothetical protein